MRVEEFINTRQPFRLDSLYSEQRGDTYVVYSYGKHWPLAVHRPDLGWYVNTDKSTRTTAKHRRLVESSINEGYDKATVQFLKGLAGESNG